MAEYLEVKVDVVSDGLVVLGFFIAYAITKEFALRSEIRTILERIENSVIELASAIHGYWSLDGNHAQAYEHALKILLLQNWIESRAEMVRKITDGSIDLTPQLIELRKAASGGQFLVKTRQSIGAADIIKKQHECSLLLTKLEQEFQKKYRGLWAFSNRLKR